LHAEAAEEIVAGISLDDITSEIVDAMKEGVHRVVTGLPPSASSRLRVNRLPE
jgi:hypothetical protein